MRRISLESCAELPHSRRGEMLLFISVRASLGDLKNPVTVICGLRGITHSRLSVWLFTGEPLAAE